MANLIKRAGLLGTVLNADASNNLYTRSEQSNGYRWDSSGLAWVRWDGGVTVTATVPATGATSVADNRLTVTTAGTRVQFSALAAKCVAITAELGNTGVIVVGASTVVASAGTRRGTPLAAGDTGIFSVSNMNLLWADATVNGEGVTFVVLA